MVADVARPGQLTMMVTMVCYTFLGLYLLFGGYISAAAPRGGMTLRSVAVTATERNVVLIH